MTRLVAVISAPLGGGSPSSVTESSAVVHPAPAGSVTRPRTNGSCRAGKRRSPDAAAPWDRRTSRWRASRSMPGPGVRQGDQPASAQVVDRRLRRPSRVDVAKRFQSGPRQQPGMQEAGMRTLPLGHRGPVPEGQYRVPLAGRGAMTVGMGSSLVQVGECGSPADPRMPRKAGWRAGGSALCRHAAGAQDARVPGTSGPPGVGVTWFSPASRLSGTDVIRVSENSSRWRVM